MIDLNVSGKPWESPELTNENRLPMRSPLYPFPSEEAARKDAELGPRGRVTNPSELPKTDWALSRMGPGVFPGSPP
ncbi:hypothetical protein MASR2M78_34040 [Treponema sp.]